MIYGRFGLSDNKPRVNTTLLHTLNASIERRPYDRRSGSQYSSTLINKPLAYGLLDRWRTRQPSCYAGGHSTFYMHVRCRHGRCHRTVSCYRVSAP